MHIYFISILASYIDIFLNIGNNDSKYKKDGELFKEEEYNAMSNFSDKCKEILKENGTNVYQLSIHASLERTALQRMVTGKRLPQLSFLKNFCQALRLSKFEEEELLELYRIESMGEDAYRNEQSILHLLKQLGALEEKESIYDNKITSIQYQNMELLSNTSSNIYDTELLIRYVLKKEFSHNTNGFIYTNLPGTHESFLYNLELFYRQFHKRLSIRHLMNFQITPSLSSENLDMMRSVLSLFISNQLDYQVFYYYSRLAKNDVLYMCFPNYIITSKHVLLLSSDFIKGIILSEKDILEQYIRAFRANCSLAAPLFQRISKLNGVLSVYKTESVPSESDIHYFHYQPCYVDLLGEEKMLEQIKQLLPEFYEIGKRFVQSIVIKAASPNLCFFSEQGVKEFCRTGKYYGQIGVFFPPLTIEQRIEALKFFQNNPMYHNYRIIKESSPISFPKHLYFELLGTSSLQIIRIESLDVIDFITIEESSICEAFYHFFQSLPTSKYIYSIEEANSFISQCIDKLSKDILKR